MINFDSRHINISGGAGMGKTHIICYLLQYVKTDNVIIVSECYKIFRNIVHKLYPNKIPNKKILLYNNIVNVLDILRENKEIDNTTLIIDDLNRNINMCDIFNIGINHVISTSQTYFSAIDEKVTITSSISATVTQGFLIESFGGLDNIGNSKLSVYKDIYNYNNKSFLIKEYKGVVRKRKIELLKKIFKET